MIKNKKSKIKNQKLTQKAAVYFLIYLFAFVPFVNAQTTQTLNSQLPPTNVSDTGFRLVVCDGPEGAGRVGPTGALGERNPDGSYKYPLKTGYIPCDFNGMMMQIQHIINIAIVVGVLVAIIGFLYAGFLYITGSGNPGKISEAHSIFKKVLIGFIIMLSAWLIVYQVLSWLTGNSGFGALLGSPSNNSQIIDTTNPNIRVDPGQV